MATKIAHSAYPMNHCCVHQKRRYVATPILKLSQRVLFRNQSCDSHGDFSSLCTIHAGRAGALFDLKLGAIFLRMFMAAFESSTDFFSLYRL